MKKGAQVWHMAQHVGTSKSSDYNRCYCPAWLNFFREVTPLQPIPVVMAA